MPFSHSIEPNEHQLLLLVEDLEVLREECQQLAQVQQVEQKKWNQLTQYSEYL